MYYSLVPKAKRAPDDAVRDWTFLSNHGHVLIHVSKTPDARVRDIAESVGITERTVLGIIFDLEEAGYLVIERFGRRNHYRVNSRLRFRHPLEANRPISSLLRIFQE
ncbi:MAG: ArsR family transcriptional regulator [Actinobacteria bacterium]|nr:ArsR family transcriptional regulator [Actinomycetota bacterium]